jgi:2-succinyl-6-hydroxy-2,4-cyclohexadiene-1-carboxylate synthase
VLPEAPDHTVQAWTLPGHVSTPALPADNFDAWVDHLAQRLREQVAAAGRAYLVGYSLGARLALGLLVRHPQLLCRVSLIGVNPGLRSEALRRSRLASDARWLAMLRTGNLEAFLQAWHQQPLFGSQQAPERVSTPQLQAWRARRHQHSPAALAAVLQAVQLGAMPDYSAQLQSQKFAAGPLGQVPTQLIVGSEDAAFLSHAQRLQAMQPQWTLRVLPRCGHNPLLEAPTDLRAALWS